MRSRIVKLRSTWSRLLSGYWFVPTVIVVVAAGLALVLIQLDGWIDGNGTGEGDTLGFTGGPDSARALLAAIASSTLTLTALVFSVTVVVLQLASGQFSPRVLRTFLRDRVNQATLGVFLATYVYSLLVLREIRGPDGPVDNFVPGLAVTGAFVLVLVAIGFFVQYIHNIATSIRVIQVIDKISSETVGSIERVHAVDAEEPERSELPVGPVVHVVRASGRGVVLNVDDAHLGRIATSDELELVVVPRVGDFVRSDGPLVEVRGIADPDEIDDHAIERCFAFGKERALDHDPAFGVRQLIDIAERALSPGINDPTTATQCLDHVHDLLHRLCRRPLPAWRVTDARVTVPQYTWEAYVSLALDEPRNWGASSIQVHRRMGAMLDDLIAEAPAHRVLVLEEQRRLLDARRSDLAPAEHAALLHDGAGAGGPVGGRGRRPASLRRP
ncbi:MAG: DUF2254 domain-containing protein [Acidimicrobiales bacterium]|nr:DUF2254 domain-containing protein [Acidimicrobiales bacterium]